MLKALKKVSSKMTTKKDDGQGKWHLGSYNTDELIGKMYMFFEAQESGQLRKGHRVKWRGSSYLKDGQKQGVDLSGGWHDAGDHLKLVFPLCWAMVQIAWAMHAGEDVLKKGTFDKQTNWQWSLQTLLHGLEFLFKCHLKPAVFVAQIGDVDCDHGECVRAEKDDHTPRPVIVVSPEKPGADMLTVASAAFSSAYAVLKTMPEHEGLAKKCFNHAQQLYTQAKANPGIYSDSNPILAKTYKNDNWEQFAYLAAAWLYESTEDETFLKEAKEWEAKSEEKRWWSDYSWGQVYFGATAVLYERTGDAFYAERLAYFADSHMNSKNGIKRTPCGLSFVTKWGSCRHAAGCAGIIASYARGLLKADPKSAEAAAMLEFAESQISYMLGACGHSFVIGFGKSPPGRPHHRDSALKMGQSGDWDAFKKNTGRNPNELTGALCGGPLEDGSWVDDREDYVGNEVALDYNAALLIGTVQCLATDALKPAPVVAE